MARLSGKMYRAAILSGHFERKKKGLLLPIFRKNRTLNMFFFVFGLRDKSMFDVVIIVIQTGTNITKSYF